MITKADYTQAVESPTLQHPMAAGTAEPREMNVPLPPVIISLQVKEKGVRRCGSARGHFVRNRGTGGHACFVSPSLKNIIPNGQLSLEGKEKGTVFLCFD